MFIAKSNPQARKARKSRGNILLYFSLKFLTLPTQKKEKAKGLSD
jgi:hypothetical protein